MVIYSFSMLSDVVVVAEIAVCVVVTVPLYVVVCVIYSVVGLGSVVYSVAVRQYVSTVVTG